MVTKNNSVDILVQQTMLFVVEDRKKSWILFLSTLFFVSLSFTLALFIPVLWIRLLLGILQGLFLSRLFVIYHDYNHQAILRKSQMADFLMSVFGMYALAPRSIWNHVHNHHHHHNSKFTDIVLGSFPILERKTFEALSKSEKSKYLFIRHPVTIALSYVSVFALSFCLYPFFENPRQYKDGLFSFFIHALLISIVFMSGGITAVLSCIVIPFFLMGMFGGYIFYAQHNSPDVKIADEMNWSYLQAALESSTYIEMNQFWKWVTANVGYHHIHHVNARIPFYRLPEVMESIPLLQKPVRTNLSFREIRNCLSLKLWDSEQGKMIRLKELKS